MQSVSLSSLLPLLLLTLPVSSVSSSPDWLSLNQTVGGRLHVGVPFSQPCFSYKTGGVQNIPNSEECSEIQAHNEDHPFRSEQFGAYGITQWETCQTTGDECLLDWVDPLNPKAFSSPAQCRQGSVPDYYIDVEGPSDVVEAFTFSEVNEVPLVIKNSGHDYIGRSAGPGSLALWMRNLDKLVLDQAFIPAGCPDSSAPATAITIGAGQKFRAIYDFAAANNVTVVGGADTTVGMSGGWTMGGGHSALSPALGLGVDRVLEFKIVTPDGKYRIANRCQNQDLFFALRGGGGGTFGVVFQSTHLTSPQRPVQALLGLYNATQENSAKLIKALAKTAVQMASDGWGGYITPSLSSAVWVNPLLDREDAENSGSGTVAAFESVGGTTVFFTMDTFKEFFDTFIAPNLDQVGRPQVMASRLIPADKFSDDTLIDALTAKLLESDFGQILAVTPFAFKDYEPEGTSIHPGWRNAVWHTLMSYSWNFNSTLAERIDTYKRLQKEWAVVRERTPGAAVYFNEADVYEPNYIEAFWGSSNYEKLLAIKEKYDPNHILDCWYCVGWKGARDSRYKCYPNITSEQQSTDSGHIVDEL
ncbi:hypothetical protein CVT26_010527 [Gymnopilus dilepis]|uniref:FAD-binding PCMH-type domain-containing protein n=1 Tax=Gymnopilus dilepis TaxID=231916 RepID=A0A409W507_9AGAR|nr:hypothetical protein CVT26_010527 [Gymnopilus dilepis]